MRQTDSDYKSGAEENDKASRQKYCKKSLAPTILTKLVAKKLVNFGKDKLDISTFLALDSCKTLLSFSEELR